MYGIDLDEEGRVRRAYSEGIGKFAAIQRLPLPAVTQEEAQMMMEELNAFAKGEKREARRDRRYSNEQATLEAVNMRLRESLLYAVSQLGYIASQTTDRYLAELALAAAGEAGKGL